MAWVPALDGWLRLLHLLQEALDGVVGRQVWRDGRSFGAREILQNDSLIGAF